MEAGATWSALVIDPDAGSRQSIRLGLEAAGARVLGVGIATAAFETLERGTFDVVLLAQRAGLDTIAELRRRAPAVAIVVLAARPTFDAALEAMRHGAADYVVEPFEPTRLREAALRALARRGPREAAPRAPSREVALGADVSLEALEREHIARIIARTPTLEAAARTLGIDATTLQRKRKRYGLT